MDERPAQALLQTPIDGHAMNSGCPLQAAVLLVALIVFRRVCGLEQQ